MKLATVRAINAHAELEYPRECCGLIIVVRGREKYIPCRNVAVGTEHFVLPAEDFAEAETQGAIMAVVHSHPDAAASPSQADLVACEESGVPWHIVRVDGVDGAPRALDLVTFEPSGYQAPLVGRTFSHGVLDCYALIRDWYRQVRGIALPDFPRPDDWWNDGHSDLYTAGFTTAGFVMLGDGEPLQKGDVILMQIRSDNGVPNHGGVYIGDGLLLHHQYGLLSTRDVYGGYFQEVTRARLRYRGHSQ
jgi:proteasome lid subunit RPN8/RPN11